MAPRPTQQVARRLRHRSWRGPGRLPGPLVCAPFRWRPRVVVRSCKVVLTEVGGDAPSDHYGVMADLELNGVAIGRGEGLGTWTEAANRLWPRPGEDR
jgi:hypothetical protein